MRGPTTQGFCATAVRKLEPLILMILAPPLSASADTVGRPPLRMLTHSAPERTVSPSAQWATVFVSEVTARPGQATVAFIDRSASHFGSAGLAAMCGRSESLAYF